MNSGRTINTYPDIGQAAFGSAGRMLVSVLLYMELFSCCVDFLILEGDNLSAVFPTAGTAVMGHHLSAKEVREVTLQEGCLCSTQSPQISESAAICALSACWHQCACGEPSIIPCNAMAWLTPLPLVCLQTLILLAALVVLPTVWLRDMSLLSYLSVGGIFASVALLALVGWEGATVTGFTHARPPLVTWPGVPVSIGLFCFCFSGRQLLLCPALSGQAACASFAGSQPKKAAGPSKHVLQPLCIQGVL